MQQAQAFTIRCCKDERSCAEREIRPAEKKMPLQGLDPGHFRLSQDLHALRDTVVQRTREEVLTVIRRLLEDLADTFGVDARV